jgi:hypothetical protein
MSPAPGTTNLVFVAMGFPILDVHKWNHKLYVHLCLAAFTQHSVSEVFACVVAQLGTSMLFTATPCFVFAFISGWTSGLMYNTAMSVHRLFCVRTFSVLWLLISSLYLHF